MTKNYAEGTSVSVEKSRAELDGLLARHGATQRVMGTDDARGEAVIAFTVAPRGQPQNERRQIRIVLPVPKIEAFATKPAPSNAYDRRPRQRDAAEQHKAWEQACRERWRLLCLLVKAKLEFVALGVSSLEREFLADLMLPDGSTVHSFLAKGIAESYQTGNMPPLLGMGGDADGAR